MSLADRLWSKYEVTEAGCWEFTGYRDRDGYGRIRRGGRTAGKMFAHRAAWELVHGPAPLPVLHRCDNPPCINPEHLFVGTRADNVADMVKKGRNRHGVTRKLQPEQVAEIRRRHRPGVHPARRTGGSTTELAREFQVSPGTIGGLVRSVEE